MARTPEIAIVEPNTLTSLGLRNLLEEIIQGIPVRIFSSFQELVDDTPDMYAHYFVSYKIFFEHTAFFLDRKYHTIVLAGGEKTAPLAGVLTLDINQDEKHLVKSIIQLYQRGHHRANPSGSDQPKEQENTLSVREIEVLTLVVKGLINKEIADRLNISLTTVITHRKNITEKLGIKSVSGLTIYAVMHGYVEADAI